MCTCEFGVPGDCIVIEDGIFWVEEDFDALDTAAGRCLIILPVT